MIVETRKLESARIIQSSHMKERKERADSMRQTWRPLNEFFITTQLYEISREKQFRAVRI